MRYTLKGYQEDAVGDVLRNLTDAHFDWQKRRRPVAFSLTATTGAGKTVMAAAVIEALFNGNPDHDFVADPGAVILWFTDDPSLNEQTRYRLLDAADGIAHSQLVVIENTFDQEKLQPGKVYFLNRQKLSSTSLLVRGAPESPQQSFDNVARPDVRGSTMWETLRDTIDDERLTLYVILDEAHRGMKAPSRSDRDEKSTIVKRLINGGNGMPPVPIVWGISATVERFNVAMRDAEGRITYPDIEVDPVRVQDSGLLKDDIRLDFPTESGQFDTVLLARATRKVREATDLWRAYAKAEGEADLVVPLLVVQVPNTPSDELLRAAFTTIQDTWPDLEADALAHVFGDHSTIELGGFTVPHLSPELVQDRTHIRVLFAKDAISTGWDCPRAEVLVSFRPAQDETHITQLLGRMVRTPLARRIPGNDVLNSVECVLPRFNVTTAKAVANTLLGGDGGEDGTGGTGGGEGRRVLVNAVDMEPNGSIPESVWEAFDQLPSQTLPRKTARPTRRLLALAQALSRDGLRPDALKEAHQELAAVLDGLRARHASEFDAAVDAVERVEGETILITVVAREVGPAGSFTELADERSVEAEFRAASRVLTPAVARRYADQLAQGDEDDGGLFDAHVQVAALARLDYVREELDEEADKLADSWFAKHRVAIKGLADARRTVYDEIKGMSPEPQPIDIKRPRVRAEATEDLEGNKVPVRTRHLMSDPDGKFPVGGLNEWEMAVVDKEMGRSGFLAWYRNPSRPSDDALAVAYKDGRDAWRRMCPDFLFFHEIGGDVKVSIVDPHGHHLGDALPKLRGLAAFAAEHSGAFHRIEAVSRMTDGTLRVLDLTNDAVRTATNSAPDPAVAYQGHAATDY